MFKRNFKPKPVKKNCPFCKEEREPDYKNFEALTSYMTERGRILGRARTGLCNKHQKRVANEVKRARHLANLQFVQGV
jgi:small subunit ribosomal protein S18